MKCSISTQEQNCSPTEESPKRLIHPDKYHLREYLVDKPNPELRRIFRLIRLQNRLSKNPEFMDPRSIVLYLNRKGWMARVIHDDLVATLGEEAIAYSTVTKYIREAKTGPHDATALPEEISPHIDDSDEAILRPLEKFSFSSVHHLFCAISLPQTTVYRRFSKELGFLARHLRCAPEILSDDSKAIPVKCSWSLRTILLAQETRVWHDLVTLDES
jgi:hypothetical protein